MSQDHRTEYVIVVTLDGLRWQEVFKGIDKNLADDGDITKDRTVINDFDATTDTARRTRLMPFLWNTIGTQGQLYGNRQLGNSVDCANPHWFSYPGYSEMLTGFVDRRIKSNKPVADPHQSVLGYINKHDEFKDRVAIFSTWNVIPNIVGKGIDSLNIMSGSDYSEQEIVSTRELLMAIDAPHHTKSAVQPDAYTFSRAFNYLKRERPRVLFIGFDETDRHAHGRRYDEYIRAAHATDRMLNHLWSWIQCDPEYRNHTTIMITTDHGRGRNARSWSRHGRLTPGSNETWMAVIGPDTEGVGEMNTTGQFWQRQFAKTLAAFIEVDYKNTRPVGDIITTMFAGGQAIGDDEQHPLQFNNAPEP